MADDFDESIKTLMEVTGLDIDGAKKVLKFRENNLDAAINYILDGNEVPEYVDDDIAITGESTGRADGPSTSTNGRNPVVAAAPAANMPLIQDEDEVRAPIPPKRDIMILPEEDNFRFRKRRTPAQNLCPLRNFAREGQLLEEELFAEPTSSSSRRKRVRLEDIFRPPVDLCYCGSFQAARDYATEKNRWLIVNLQDHTEFLSQCLNRDVWSNKDLKTVIKKFFIFWQVSIDTSEGARFKTFYTVSKCPHVCVIDPRTGEHKIDIESNTMKAANFIRDLYAFLKENGPHPASQEEKNINGLYNIIFTDANGVCMKMEDDAVILASPSKLSQPSTSRSGFGGSSAAGSAPSIVPFEKLTEEEQIELAIKKSLAEAAKSDDDDTSDDNEADAEAETFSDEDEVLSQPKKKGYEMYLGADTDPKTKLQLRLPNDVREILEWPSTSKVLALKLYVKQKYPALTRENKYKILNTSAFPKRNILDLSDDTTFDKCDLHPFCILYLHPDD